MPTETFLQREAAANKPIQEQALPKISKHDLDEAYKRDHELALYQQEMEEYQREMKLYTENNEIQLAETFDTKKAVANEIKEQLEHGGLKYIEDQSAPKAA